MRTVDAARLRGVARFFVAFGFAVVLSAVLWYASPPGLRAPIDIIGYPSFFDFDFHRQFLAYRLAMWMLPLVTLAVWWLLGRAGLFTVERPPRRGAPLTDAPLAHARVADVPEADAQRGTDDSGSDAPVRAGDDDRGSSDRRHDDDGHGVARYGRLLPTGLLVAVVASSGSGGDPRRTLTLGGVLVGVAVVAVILLIAGLLARVTSGHTRRAPAAHWHTSLAAVHTFLGATVIVGALWWWAHHSAVRLVAVDDLVRYPWVSWWAALLLWGLTLGALVLGARRSRPGRLEGAVVRVLTGSVLVYLVTSQMAAQIGPIQGFDDMQSVTGADLMSRGFFPWKDFTFIHGLFEDALRSSAGFSLFGHTLWATNAALGLIWIPLTWVGVYWVGVWASRGRALPLVAVTLLLIWTAAHIGPSYRWVAVGLVLVLLGEAVRRGGWRWTALLTVVLFVEAVLVPEASFQVIAATLALIGSDLVHRAPGVTRWRGLVRARAFVLTGLVCTVVWCGFLATQGALVAFVNYYLVFGPGHAESGALPIPDLAAPVFRNCFTVVVVIAGVSLWLTGFALVRRWRLSSRHWVAFAAALTTALYAEKGLARFDDGHLLQVVTVATPLVAVWVALILSRLDDGLHRLLGGTPAEGRRRAAVARSRFRLPAVRASGSAVVAVVLVLALPSVRQAVDAAPGNNASYVGGGEVPGLGWTAGDAVDPVRLSDLRTVVDTYTIDGPVFDFTNSPGYFYYLFGEDPPTSYFHVSMAIPEFTQEIVIDELEETRPELVVFDAPFGLPGWDGPHNQVRHYTLAQWLLDGWTPVLRTQGVLFMVRNDLLDDVPPPPQLSDGPELNRLWFAAPVCDLGYTANFLSSDPTGEELTLDVEPPETTRRVTFRGWSYDAQRDRPVRLVTAVVGGVVVASVGSAGYRPDVAEILGRPEALVSGFAEGFDTRRRGEVSFYAVYSDGVAHPIGEVDPRDSLTRPGQDPIPVSPEPATGSVDLLAEEEVEVSRVPVPADTDLASYQLAELSSSTGDIGTSELELTDSATILADREQSILAGVLPLAGDSIRLRVGSCLPWHGYTGDTLYLTQRDVTNPVDRIVLSDVTRPFAK